MLESTTNPGITEDLLIPLLESWKRPRFAGAPYHPAVGCGRHYNLQMTSTPLEQIENFDCVLIATDHSAYDYTDIVRPARLVIDTRGATRGLEAEHVFRC